MAVYVTKCTDVDVRCDSCRSRELSKSLDCDWAGSVSATLKVLREKGWRIGKVVHCPNCSMKRSNP